MFKGYGIFTDSGGAFPWGWQLGWIGVGWVWVCGGCPMHTYMHMHMHTCTHACTHMHVENMINTDASIGGGHLQFLYMYTCPCMHVHMCGDTSLPPDTHPPTCPLHRATGSPKHQNSISLKLIEIFRFCLKILYL